MTTQTVHTSKLPVLFPLLASLLLFAEHIKAASIAEDVNNLAETAKSTTDAFLQESFSLRLKYQYNGCSLDISDRQNLYNLAAKASEQLRAISKVQQSLKTKIENYQATDWDDKYGKTGLWRKLTSDLYVTTLFGCDADYYLAITAEPDEKNKILLDILTRIDSIDKSIRSPDAMLIKTKTTAQLARTELAYKPSAIHLLNSLAADQDVPEATRFRAAIEQISFFGNSDDDKVDELLKKLDRSSCRDDLELVLALAFFKQQKDTTTFEKTIAKWPQTKDYLAFLVLNNVLGKIANKQDITQISIFDTELAVLAVWKNNVQNHIQLLDKFASIEKFQTSLILYVTGLAFAESAPTKAIDLLIRASKLQQLHRNSYLDIEPEKIAEQAAKLAYNLFLSDSSTCPLAVETFQNYLTIAAGKTDMQLEYLYTVILNQCGRQPQATDLLKKIATGPDDGLAELWHKRASFDLILQTMSQTTTEDAARNSIIEQLASLIDDCPNDNIELAQLRTEAVTIYCQLLLENNNTVSARKALDILSYSQTHQPTLTLLKSKALFQLDRLAESARMLLDLNDPNYTGFYNHAMVLLEQTTEKIDLLQSQEQNFQQTIQTCEKISHICYAHLKDTQKYQAGIYFAEITLFSDENHPAKILQAAKLLSDLEKNSPQDPNLVRCRARLLTEQGKFEQAANIWAKIAKKLEPNCDRWWRAKFFELNCASQVKNVSKNNIAHSIEVLEASWPDVPPFWDKKLKLLKQNCHADISSN